MPNHNIGVTRQFSGAKSYCASQSRDISRLTWIIYRCNSASIKSIFQHKLRMSALCILITPAYNSAYAKRTLLKWIRNYALHK